MLFLKAMALSFLGVVGVAILLVIAVFARGLVDTALANFGLVVYDPLVNQYGSGLVNGSLIFLFVWLTVTFFAWINLDQKELDKKFKAKEEARVKDEHIDELTSRVKYLEAKLSGSTTDEVQGVRYDTRTVREGQGLPEYPGMWYSETTTVRKCGPEAESGEAEATGVPCP